MTKGTFWLEMDPDGGVSIGVEDYDVEDFGGCDYEWIYTLDRANKEKFIATLRKTQSNPSESTENTRSGSPERLLESSPNARSGLPSDTKTGSPARTPESLSIPEKCLLEDLVEAEFGIHLDKKSMKMWFDENGIKYDFHSWVHSKLSRTHDLLKRGK